MVNKNLIEFGRPKVWHRTKEHIFGLFEGYQCNIAGGSWFDNPRQTVVSCQFGHINKEQQNTLSSFLEENKKKLGFKEYEVEEIFAVIVFHDTWKTTSAKTLDQLLLAFTAELKRLEISPFYADENRDYGSYKHYDRSGVGVMLHPDDYQLAKQQIAQYNQQRLLERTSYLSGAGGALLFVLPLIVIWVLVAYYFNIITAIGGILISLAAYYGYDKFKGKEDIGMKVILVLVTILAILVANVTTIHVQLAEYGLSVTETMELLQYDPSIKEVFIKDLGISMLFGAIGIGWVVFGLSTKPEYIKEAEKVS